MRWPQKIENTLLLILLLLPRLQNFREGVEETESSSLKEILQDAPTKQNGDEWYKPKYYSVITRNTGYEEVSQRDIEHVVLAPRRSLRLAK